MTQVTEYPRKDCEFQFVSRKECALMEKNVTLQVDQIKKDIKAFRNQLAAIFSGAIGLSTLLLILLQYLESVK